VEPARFELAKSGPTPNLVTMTGPRRFLEAKAVLPWLLPVPIVLSRYRDNFVVRYADIFLRWWRASA